MVKAKISELAAFQAWNGVLKTRDGDEEETWEEYIRGRVAKRENPTLEEEAGVAFKDALLNLRVGDSVDEIVSGKFDFYCGLDFDAALPRLEGKGEFWKIYGDLAVFGEIDNVQDKTVRVYRLIGDELGDELAERCFDSYEWRVALDATGSDTFEYIFIEAWASPMAPWSYMLVATQTIRQHRYPDLASDCATLAVRYMEAAQSTPELIEQ